MTKRFEEFARERFSDGEEILVISGEPNCPFGGRFHASQLAETPQQLVDVGNGAVEVREGEVLPGPCPRGPHELPEPEAGDTLQPVGDGPGSAGAGEVAAGGAEVGDAGEGRVCEGEEVSDAEIRSEG